MSLVYPLDLTNSAGDRNQQNPKHDRPFASQDDRPCIIGSNA
ncbi:hypothetical protein [Stenomitos frigidus]|nr:hypothetical protein [Stenomitos frigidus]